MKSDDRNDKGKELERKLLLEEIRKRAEEAELKRIEEEELRVGGRPASPSQQTPPTLASDIELQAREERIVQLAEKFNRAMERRKADKAGEILAELVTIASPNDPRIPTYKRNLAALKDELQLAKGRKSFEGKSPKEDATAVRARREAQRKKVAELLEKASGFYQNERYDKGISMVEEVLAIDEENEEALALRDQIARAQQLAEQLKAEELKRKSEETESSKSGAPVSPVPPPIDRSDIWGTRDVKKSDAGYEVPRLEDQPTHAPKPPAGRRIVENISKIQIPVKALVTTAVVIGVAIAAYYAFESIWSIVSPPKYSLLVLPAKPVAADTSLDYLAAAYTEDLIRDLVMVPELRVVGPVTAMTHRYASVNLAQAAKGLGAGYFLDWSFSLEQDAYSIRLNFMDTAASAPRFATHLRSSLRELPLLRQQMARLLADTMNISLSPRENAYFQRPIATAPETYQAYLMGRYYLQNLSRYPLQAAMSQFETALLFDSTFADAIAAIGWANILVYDLGLDASPAAVNKASTSVQRVVGLGVHVSEIYRVWGMVEFFRGRYDKAVERLDYAVSLAPSDVESQRRLAVAHTARGSGEQALKAAVRSAADDPRNPEAYALLGLVHYFNEQYPAARAAFENGLKYAQNTSEYGSRHYTDVLVYVQSHDRAIQLLSDRVAAARQSYVDVYRLGRAQQTSGKAKQQWEATFQRARDIIETQLRSTPRDPIALSYLALVQTRLGQHKVAAATMNRAISQAPDNYDVLYLAARMYSIQKETTQALQYLSKAIDKRYRLDLLMDMDFFALRQTSEYQKAATR
jgi:tetratricopeptide (TPR) repeat protein